MEVEGTTMRAYLDCNLVMTHTDANIEPSGQVGMRTYQSRTYYDDIRVFIHPGI